MRDGLKVSKIINSDNKKFLITLLSTFIFIFLITFISAQPPFSESNTNGIEIKIPEIGTLQQNQNFTFNFHLYNQTNGVPIDNSSTSCYLHLYSPNGFQVFEGEVPHRNSPTISNEWEILALDGNFSVLGDNAYAIQCNSTTLNAGGFKSVGFEVTPAGRSTSTFLFIFLVIIALTFILGVSLQNNWIIFFGFLEILFLGFFILIYGVDIFKDVTTTRAIGFILWGISIIGIFKSVEGMLAEGGWK